MVPASNVGRRAEVSSLGRLTRVVQRGCIQRLFPDAHTSGFEAVPVWCKPRNKGQEFSLPTARFLTMGQQPG